MPEKFDTKKFIKAFGGGVGSSVRQRDVAVSRAKRLSTAIKGVQKQTGFTREQSINVLKGLNILIKGGVSQKKLQFTKNLSPVKSAKFLGEVASLGAGKTKFEGVNISQKKEKSFKSFLDPRPGGPFSLEGKIPKPPSPTSLFKKVKKLF